MLGLEFIELKTERFDLVFPWENRTPPALQVLVDALRSPAFKRRAKQLGGYDTSQSGTVQAEL